MTKRTPLQPKRGKGGLILFVKAIFQFGENCTRDTSLEHVKQAKPNQFTVNPDEHRYKRKEKNTKGRVRCLILILQYMVKSVLGENCITNTRRDTNAQKPTTSTDMITGDKNSHGCTPHALENQPPTGTEAPTPGTNHYARKYRYVWGIDINTHTSCTLSDSGTQHYFLSPEITPDTQTPHGCTPHTLENQPPTGTEAPTGCHAVRKYNEHLGNHLNKHTILTFSDIIKYKDSYVFILRGIRSFNFRTVSHKDRFVLILLHVRSFIFRRVCGNKIVYKDSCVFILTGIRSFNFRRECHIRIVLY